MAHGGFSVSIPMTPNSPAISCTITPKPTGRADRGMLDFAVNLTKHPSRSKKADVERLRSLGLDDQQILSTVLITCVFNFMTRLADGLGVEIQDDRVEAAKRWMSADVQAMDWLMEHKEK